MTDFAQISKWLAVCLSMATVAVRPVCAFGAGGPNVAQIPHMADIALESEGIFRGQVLDQTGKPAAGSRVALYHSGRLVAETNTDLEGHFAVAGVRGGIHRVQWQAVDGDAMSADFRLWRDGTAPPGAKSSVLMINGNDIARGQHYPGKVWCFLSNPWVTAGLLSAAIAIPIALTNDDSAS